MTHSACLSRAGASRNKIGDMMRKTFLAALLLGASATAAGAIDLNDLVPCKRAAVAYCSQYKDAYTTDNMMRCAAILVANSHLVGDQCRQVLRRYGQLS